jgi:hypothetical protein
VLLNEGTVRIVWGKRFALPVHSYRAADISDLTVTNEQRFSVMPTGNITRVYAAPDRWRMRAMYRGRSINLGSYETQFKAMVAKDMIKAERRNDDSGIYHYGRA